MSYAIGRFAQLLPPRRRIGVRARQLDGTDGLEERSARARLSQSQCRVGWSPPISRTPPGFELSAPFAFSDTTPRILASIGQPSLRRLCSETSRRASLEFVCVFGQDAREDWAQEAKPDAGAGGRSCFAWVRSIYFTRRYTIA